MRIILTLLISFFYVSLIFEGKSYAYFIAEPEFQKYSSEDSSFLPPLSSIVNQRQIKLVGHTGTVFNIAISNDSKSITSGSSDSTARTWDVSSGKSTGINLHQDDENVTDVDYSSDGKYRLSVGLFSGVYLRDKKTGKVLKTFGGDAGEYDGAKFSPDGKTIAVSGLLNGVSGASNYDIILWNHSTDEVKVLKGHTFVVSSFAYSPDGGIIISSGEDNTIRVWDTSTAELLKTIAVEETVYSLSFNYNGKSFASSSFTDTIKIWDTISLKVINEFKDESNSYFRVKFSPNGKLLAAGGDQGYSTIWDVNSGKVVQKVRGHEGWIQDITFSPNGKIFASSGEDWLVLLTYL